MRASPDQILSRLIAGASYVALNAALASIVFSCFGYIASTAPAAVPQRTAVAQAPVVSRVDQFLAAEVAARAAPQVPVRRMIVAYTPSQVATPVLAAQLDRAESLPGQRLTKKQLRKSKNKLHTVAKRTVKPAAKNKPALIALLDPVLPAELKPEPKLKLDRIAYADESARDITYRNLGIGR